MLCVLLRDADVVGVVVVVVVVAVARAAGACNGDLIFPAQVRQLLAASSGGGKAVLLLSGVERWLRTTSLSHLLCLWQTC